MMALVCRLKQSSRKFGQSSVRDGDAGKMSRVNCNWCEEKVGSEVLRKYGVRVK